MIFNQGLFTLYVFSYVVVFVLGGVVGCAAISYLNCCEEEKEGE